MFSGGLEKRARVEHDKKQNLDAAGEPLARSVNPPLPSRILAASRWRIAPHDIGVPLSPFVAVENPVVVFRVKRSSLNDSIRVKARRHVEIETAEKQAGRLDDFRRCPPFGRI